MRLTVFMALAACSFTGCVVVAGKPRPVWSPGWVQVTISETESLLNLRARLTDDHGNAIPGGEVVAVGKGVLAGPVWERKTRDYVDDDGGELRLGPGEWEIEMKPPIGLKPLRPKLRVESGRTYTLLFHTTWSHRSTIQ